MKILTLISVISLTIVPSIAMARGCSGGSHSAAIECPDGQSWNADIQLCQVSQTS